MKRESFGEYLVGKGHITKEQHGTALRIQNKDRLLGEIAIETNYLSREEVDEVEAFVEKNPDLKFGEAAITFGYLTASKLRYLLDIRTRRKVRIGDILTQHGFIAKDILHREVMNFNAKRKKLKSVLICEPASTIRHILQLMLEKYDYTVLHAKTGEEAFDAATRAQPDILITSVVLEDMDGYRLCHKVISGPQTAATRLIILSSDVTVKNIERAFEAGANHFLAKPIKEHELINILYQLEREEFEKKPETILVVDDSPGARMIIRKELEKRWSNIHMAANGKEGVEKARQIKPDIITMDIEMPEMNGLEACKLLSEDPETENIPVVMVTSSDTPENRVRWFEAGAVEYFGKPFKPGSLSDFLKMLIEARKIQKKEKVLVVEDNKTTRHILKYFFQKNGYNVYTATNGEEALEILPICMPDIIVTDRTMPGMDGFTFTAEVRKMDAYRRTPIIMLTASAEKKDMVKSLSSGASDYISKPFEEAELFARINAHLKNKQLFEQLEEEKEKLEKINKEKDRFLSIAAHDLRNPLGSIIGFSELLRDEDDLDEETRNKFVRLISDAGRGMLHLLEDLLDISKIESGKVIVSKTASDLNELVDRRVQLAGVLARQKQITIHYTGQEDIILDIDAPKIEQVIDNMISNAIKFTKPGKNIFVLIEREEAFAKVFVRDEGVGIPQEEQSKLFTPFSRLSVTPTGGEKSTGLGLAISASIVRAHGGEVDAKSTVGEGTTFLFTLPITSPE